MIIDLVRAGVDLIEVDLIGGDLMRIDLVTCNQKHS